MTFILCSSKIEVMTRTGDVIAGGAGGMGPCPPPQHQPPGGVYTHIILCIYNVCTMYINCISQKYTIYIQYIYLIYTKDIQYIYLVYTMYILRINHVVYTMNILGM
jgi:hypothetical protein